MTTTDVHSIDLFSTDTLVRVAGVIDIERTTTGGALSRLPRWTRAQITDPAILPVAAMPVGGRLEFTTDADAIEVVLQLTHLHFGPLPLQGKTIDLVVDGELAEAASSTEGHLLHFPDRATLDFEFHAGGPATFLFNGLGSTEKQVELWLPHNAMVELQAVRVPEGARVQRTEPAGRRWVHYGSSISHCTEMLRPTDVWPVVVARRAGVDLQSLALSGQCQLDQFVARTIRDLPLDLLSMEAGSNLLSHDSMRERAFVPALHGFLDTVRDGHPDVPILVFTPAPNPDFEDLHGPAVMGTNGRWHSVKRPPELATGVLTGRRIRELSDGVVQARRAAGDDQLHFVSGQEFGDIGPLSDGLHPSIEGYGRMGRRFFDLAFGPGRPFA